MREYSLGIPTNAWNAIRYVLITLALVPLAENLWARVHSKLTGARLMRNRTVRLRQSKLAHWGLHQEVDEKSRASKVSAVVIAVLHITSTLLLEYGSGSEERYMMQDAVLSRTVRDDGGLRKSGVYFFDAGYVLRMPYDSAKCIDGKPRTLRDFGLTLRKVDNEKFLKYWVPPVPLPGSKRFQSKPNRLVKYRIKNSDYYLEVHDNGTARWYCKNKDPYQFPYDRDIVGFVNETIACRSGPTFHSLCIADKGRVEDGVLLSDILAWSILPGALPVNWAFLKQNKMISAILDRVTVTSDMGPLRDADAEQQTTWIRRGMPSTELPQEEIKGLSLNLKIDGMQEGCEHKHSVPVSNLDPLKDIKVSEASFPGTLPAFNLNSNLDFSKNLKLQNPNFLVATGHFLSDPKLVVWSDDNWIQVGNLFQQGDEFCSYARFVCVCVKKVESRRHEMAIFDGMHHTPDFVQFEKAYNFSVLGELPQHGAVDLAIQANAEVTKRNSFTGAFGSIRATQKRVVNMIESGKLVSGLLRVAGKEVRGKSVSYFSDIATINILGIVGAVILVFLAALPIPFLFVYRQSVKVDIESLYRRVVMQMHGSQECMEEICGDVPVKKPPSIIAIGVSEGKIEKFQYSH